MHLNNLLLDCFIGHLPLEAVHIGNLQTFIQARRKDKVKNRTINHGLQLVRQILNLAAAVGIRKSVTYVGNGKFLSPTED